VYHVMGGIVAPGMQRISCKGSVAAPLSARALNHVKDDGWQFGVSLADGTDTVAESFTH
jgi:hypothetical protein